MSPKPIREVIKTRFAELRGSAFSMGIRFQVSFLKFDSMYDSFYRNYNRVDQK